MNKRAGNLSSNQTNIDMAFFVTTGTVPWHWSVESVKIETVISVNTVVVTVFSFYQQSNDGADIYIQTVTSPD